MKETAPNPLANKAINPTTPQWQVFVLRIELAVTVALASSNRPYDRNRIANVVETGEALSAIYQTCCHQDAVHLQVLRQLESYAPMYRQEIADAIRHTDHRRATA